MSNLSFVAVFGDASKTGITNVEQLYNFCSDNGIKLADNDQTAVYDGFIYNVDCFIKFCEFEDGFHIVKPSQAEIVDHVYVNANLNTTVYLTRSGNPLTFYGLPEPGTFAGAIPPSFPDWAEACAALMHGTDEKPMKVYINGRLCSAIFFSNGSYEFIN